MRVSDRFQLGLGQPALDFVNVDDAGDAPVYIDPRALRLMPTPWGNECVSLIQDFFTHVLESISADRREDAISLLQQLREPNETHLGLSQGRSRGRALGPQTAVQIYDALAASEAVKSKLVADLEETALMVEGIGFDIISDIATNIIRGPLIEYTQQQADLLGIPLEAQDSGPMWDPAGRWYNELQDLPRAGGNKLLLVPKTVVRAKLHYNAEDYFNNYVLNYLREEEIAQGSELVRLLKDGRPRVDKKDLREKYGEGKRIATRITLDHPDILAHYRQQRGGAPPAPYSQEQLLDKTGELPASIDWSGLVDRVRQVTPGGHEATAFHKAAQALLTAVLHPWLTMPIREHEIHQGRKRIDISYTNAAQDGFFSWFADHKPSMTVPVECKNYSSDPANPELDQLAGRFSPRRGVLGLLVCRSFDDKDKFLERCRDTAHDDRGFIIALDDDDLAFLAERRRNEDFSAMSRLFRERFDHLVS
jgi:hypothetical protein